jgi:hypothetical protein
MSRMADAAHVYLSPHHDDVCFSIGVLAARQGGDLVDVFTQSGYVAADVDLPADRDARTLAVTDLRRREDLEFARAAGLRRHDLGLCEAALLRPDPFDLSDLDADVALLSERLVPCLLGLFPGEGGEARASLYCPAGIGGHRDHVAALLTVARLARELAGRFRLYLYEDLPYASKAKARHAGLVRAREVLPHTELTRIVLPLSPQEARRKMDWVGLYASQHPRPPDIAQFTPASGLDAGRHEAVWRVDFTEAG